MAPFNIQRIEFGHLVFKLLRIFNILCYPYYYLKKKIIEMNGTEGSESKMKITDLPIDCLQEIFEYLDLENLLNVADSNERLNIAACFVYRREHGKKRVYFNNKNYARNYAYLRINGREIEVSKATVHLRFLRCFGCVTSNLMIYFDKVPQHQVDKTLFYINEYCAESLIKLVISGYGTGPIVFPHLQRPFVNIEMVSFDGCHLGTNVMQFNKWFPKMRHLELYENQLVEKECIEMNFPNLRYLSYDPFDSKEYLVPHLENIVRLNSNLLTLELYYWSKKLLQNVSKYLPQLEELKIVTKYPLRDYGTGQVRFKSLKKFEFNKYLCKSEILSKINFLFDQLEEFHATGIKFNDLLTFVTKHSTIKKFKLCYYRVDDMSTENALQIAKSLPLLFELHLDLEEVFSVDKIIHYMDELKQVKKFHFKLDDQTVDDLRARLGNKWKVSVDLERRTWKRFIILQCCH